MSETELEKRFWRYWLVGILLFAVMIIMSALRDTAGIVEHQVAGTALKVDMIQRQWQSDGALSWVRIGMIVDFIFIATYSWGAWNGGKFMRIGATPGGRRIGGLVMAASLVFLLTDYTETICQFIQLMQFKGSDLLAGIAATVQPVKMVAWLTTFVGLLVGLLLRRMAR